MTIKHEPYDLKHFAKLYLGTMVFTVLLHLLFGDFTWPIIAEAAAGIFLGLGLVFLVIRARRDPVDD